MESLKINKNNWSGDETIIKKYADGKRVLLEDGTTLKTASGMVFIKEEGYNSFEGTDMSLIDMDGYFIAANWNHSITRENKDPLVAIAQLYFNLY